MFSHGSEWALQPYSFNPNIVIIFIVSKKKIIIKINYNLVKDISRDVHRLAQPNAIQLTWNGRVGLGLDVS